MTVSMLTTRLSEVITGCGGNDTTCSRRSTPARTRSTNGMSRCRPASSVRVVAPEALDDERDRLRDDPHRTDHRDDARTAAGTRTTTDRAWTGHGCLPTDVSRGSRLRTVCSAGATGLRRGLRVGSSRQRTPRRAPSGTAARRRRSPRRSGPREAGADGEQTRAPGGAGAPHLAASLSGPDAALTSWTTTPCAHVRRGVGRRHRRRCRAGAAAARAGAPRAAAPTRWRRR